MPRCHTSTLTMADLQRWYGCALGAELACLERACIQRLLNDTFGYHLIQLGALEHIQEALGASRIHHRVLLAEPGCGMHAHTGLIAEASALPLASDSVDACLLPHRLDLERDPRQILAEVERVLIPEGRIIILGFNALSLWGLTRALRLRRTTSPWSGYFHAGFQVETWLSELGFEIEQRESLMFRPPLEWALSAHVRHVEQLGQRLWPSLGAVYALRAVKRVATLTPLRPAWRKRRCLLPGRPVEPTTRDGGDHV